MDWDFLREEQEWLAKQVYIPTEEQIFAPQELLFAIDIQYVEEEAYCAVAVFSFAGRHINTFVYKTQTGMEYKAGFFCFREGPPVLRTIRKILNTQHIVPSLIIIDGHGIAHPRGLGVASWIGVKTNIPSMGIAKRALLKYDGELQEERGATLPILRHQKTVGHVLRTQQAVKPVFVSPGYKISLEQATYIALNFSPDYRISNPIRLADHAARNYAKGERSRAFIEL